MSDRRNFFTKLFTDPARLFSNPQIRDVELRKGGQFIDVRRNKAVGDPLQMDAEEKRNKLILVNFFSSKYGSHREVMRNLAEIANRLQDRLNREVFINSVTVTPEHDTAERLEAFVEELGAPHGWTFVRATGEASNEIVGRMRRVRGYTSTNEVFYGTPGGFWGTFPAKNSPAEVAHRLAHSIPRAKPETPRRAGPARRGAEKLPWSAREV